MVNDDMTFENNNFNDSDELDLEEIHMAQQKCEKNHGGMSDEEEIAQNKTQIEAAENQEKMSHLQDNEFEQTREFPREEPSGSREENFVLDLNIVDVSDSDFSDIEVTNEEILEDELILEDLELALDDEPIEEKPEDELIFHTTDEDSQPLNASDEILETSSDDLDLTTFETDTINTAQTTKDLNFEDELTFEELDIIDTMQNDDDHSTANEMSSLNANIPSVEATFDDNTNFDEILDMTLDDPIDSTLDNVPADEEQTILKDEPTTQTQTSAASDDTAQEIPISKSAPKLEESSEALSLLRQLHDRIKSMRIEQPTVDKPTKKMFDERLTLLEDKIIELTINSNAVISEEIVKLTKYVLHLENTILSIPEKTNAKETSVLKQELSELKEHLTLQLVQLFEGISFNEELIELRTYLEEKFAQSGVEAKANNSGELSELTKKVDYIINQIAGQNQSDSLIKRVDSIETKILEKLDYLEEQEIFGGKTDLITNLQTALKDILNNSAAKKSISESKESSSEENTASNSDTKTQVEAEVTGYAYSLTDVESDLTKLRMAINDIGNVVSELKTERPDLTSEQLQLDSISDDISSISKRTNKLILTSEDAHKTLKHYLEDFEQTINTINESSDSLKAYPQQISALNSKLDNITRLILSATKSDKAINDALVYLAQWIDGASVSFDRLKKELYLIKTESFLNQADKIQSLEMKIQGLENKFEEQARADRELKSMMELILEQLSAANSSLKRSMSIDDKLDMLEHKMSKFEKNINKIASYIEE